MAFACDLTLIIFLDYTDSIDFSPFRVAFACDLTLDFLFVIGICSPNYVDSSCNLALSIGCVGKLVNFCVMAFPFLRRE